MKLRGIEFGKVFGASGLLHFFGAWRHHKYLKYMPGFGFKGLTFIAKTTTLAPNMGNLDFDDGLQPKEFLPECIYLDFSRGIVLNAVGLGGPGAKRLFDTGKWQRREAPFVISFAPIASAKEARLEEMQGFVELFADHLPDFAADVALELDISCPNIRYGNDELSSEVIGYLEAASCLDVPMILKLSAASSVATAKKIAASGLCDAFDISNAIPFGQLANQIDWHKLFGDYSKEHMHKHLVSPLEKYGGGGLSGKPLLSVTAMWIGSARRLGINIPIIGGGGILSKNAVDIMMQSGANAISIGTVAMLRPWRVQGIINYANKVIK